MLRRFGRSLFACLLVPAMLAGCGPMPGAAPSPPPAPPADQVDGRLTDGMTRFSFDLFQQLRAADPRENLFISPASVNLALSLTQNGAGGATAEEIAKALSLTGLSREEINQANQALQSILINPDPKVQLSIANSIWYQKGMKVHPDFLALSEDHYRAEVEAVAFGTAEATDSINRWVSRATREKIPTIVDRTDGDDRMFLINAIYFNGLWKQPFEAEATQPRPFHLANGTKRTHPMMSQSGSYRYLLGDGFQAAALPYGDQGRVNLYLLLPDEGVEPDAFFSGLTAEKWANWTSEMRSREGRITLPKVKLEYEAELTAAMKALGMDAAFDPKRADFSGLFVEGEDDLHIGGIIHKTFLEMDEKGTEAAAVTGVVIRTTSAPAPDSRFEMVLDRPFLMLIQDDRTGAILFLGAIMDPA